MKNFGLKWIFIGALAISSLTVTVFGTWATNRAGERTLMADDPHAQKCANAAWCGGKPPS